MPRPTQRVRDCERSSIRVMFDLANSSDDDLVRLEVGEPDFDTPAHVIDAAASAARDGHTHYTSNAGLPRLRRAISETLLRDFSVDYAPDEVLVTTGGMEALHLAVLSMVEPGEELVVPSPGWPNYWTQARLADGRVVEVPLDPATGYELDPDRVIDAMGPNTAAVLLCRPSNPTGRVFDPDRVRAVVEAAADHDAYVIADEVYLALTYDGTSNGIAGLVDDDAHVFTVGSCSKSYAMTGWRVGWLAGDPAIVDEATKIRESTTACTSSVAQHAALAALTGPQEPYEEMYTAFEARRDFVVDRVAEIDGLDCPRPEGAFYAFLDVDLPGSSLAVAKRLFDECGVVLAPGGGFGDAGEGRLRLSFATSLSRLEEGFDRLERVLA